MTAQRRILWLGLAAGVLALLAFWLWPRHRANLLLITLDTTRADHLGCYGCSTARTPALDALAAAGMLCDCAYTVAPLTLPAHASLYTGLYPAEHGIRTNARGMLDAAVPTLTEVLARKGYDTAAFVASKVLDSKYGLARGFKTYNDLAGDDDAAEALVGERNAGSVVDTALEWLKAPRSRPFFCWVHLFDPHSPYLPHTDLFGDEFAERPYDAEIAYVDQQVGRLLEYLKARGLDSQTLVVVVGDHGEGLGEHFERQHGMTLYNATLHVPLIFRYPAQLAPGGRLAANVSMVDV
ncbi:MAG TPA: sulfatase, partial [Planctomycetaceae bacterium]